MHAIRLLSERIQNHCMMDALKQKFGEQNPEERDRRKKQLIGINFFQLALCLTMVIIGVQYNDLEDCRSGDAPKYLLLGRVLDIMSNKTCVAAILFWIFLISQADLQKVKF